MTLTDIDAERFSTGYGAAHPAPSQPLASPGDRADTWVFQLDLGVHGIAIDLTDPAWPKQLARGLDELAPLLPSEVDLGHQDTAAVTAADTTPGTSAGSVMGSSVLTFVDARTAELVDQGAVSILLLPSASALAPVVVGAVFVQQLHSGTVSMCAPALEFDGWTISAPGSGQFEPSERFERSERLEHGSTRANNAIRGQRSVSIPGVAGLLLNEQLVLLATDDSVVTVLFQGASSESADDLSDSVIMTAVMSARLEKN